MTTLTYKLHEDPPATEVGLKSLLQRLIPLGSPGMAVLAHIPIVSVPVLAPHNRVTFFEISGLVHKRRALSIPKYRFDKRMATLSYKLPIDPSS
jgi:hypothetical protein